MKSGSVLCLLNPCLLVGLVLLGSAVHASGIFETVTPHAGSDLESAIIELRAMSDQCCPFNEDLIFADCTQESAYRVSWEPGCFRIVCPRAGYGGQTVYRGAGGVWMRVDYQIYRAYATCSRAGTSVRTVCLFGTWDPATYDKQVSYFPDPYVVTDKNAGSCSGNCDAMVRD
jgi:hypothetical protein